MFFKYTATCLAAICSLSTIALLLQKRDTQIGITLYAYGEEANGTLVFYHDGGSLSFPLIQFLRLTMIPGLAYIGQSAPSNWTGTTVNVIVTADSSHSTVLWTITSNSSSVTFNSTLKMYTIPISRSFSQIRFASSGDIPTDSVTTSFAWFGTSKAYATSESHYELLFWAK